MRIWFAAHIADHSTGGVGRSILESSNELKSRGHTVVIFTKKTLKTSNYFVFSLRLLNGMLLSLHALPDWIIARSTDGLFCALAARILHLKTKVILHNHGWEELSYAVERRTGDTSFSHGVTGKGRYIRFPLLRLTLALSYHCMSGTLYETRFLYKKYPSNRHKLIYIPNGVHPQPHKGWPSRSLIPPYFLSVGVMTWKKNIAHVLGIIGRVQKAIPEAKLICVGTGVDNETFFSMDGVVREGITNIPYVHHSNIDYWYTTCPFLIHASRYEGGHPFVILEAMSFGCIVFAVPIPSVKEILSDGHNGYFISGRSVDRDAEIICTTLYHPDNTGIRAAAIHKAERNSWKHQVDRLERVLCPPIA